ncbi:MAG TPA: sulfurtransferase TusA family protein [Candidatus Tenderia electrophaga]|uniref:Sulfurtransferase TusA family protein n=1 Tax=Candidatus Tenderia electrophaga TaxID=1748243 RepID=A0A832N759_9GAMM|nr:sulfurtransferase TusA family protein [Candidatus Tenderia electrophaga]
MAEPIDRELDTSGLDCPMPILKLKQALKSMQSGQRVRVIATDPGTQSDFLAFTAQTGHRLLESAVNEGKYIYLLEKA